MSSRELGRLSAVVGLAAGSALLSYHAVAQPYFRPLPPPPQVYYSPQPEPDELPPAARPSLVEPGELRPSDRSPQWRSEDLPPAVRSPQAEPDNLAPAARFRQAEPDDLPPAARSRQVESDEPPRPPRSHAAAPKARDTADQDIPARDVNSEPRKNEMPATTTPVHVVSLRAGPSGGDAIIGTLRPGTSLEVLGSANGWVQVRSSSGTGWAYGSYLASGGGRSSTSAGDVTASQTPAADVAGGRTPAADVAGGRSSAAEISSSSAAKPSSGASPGGGASEAKPKPLGTANPALNGGGPPIKTSGSLDAHHSGLASQISSP